MADLPCPTCGSALTFLDQYQRYYCHRCLQYAPEGYGDRGAQTCPTCGGLLSYVRQYGRMYCYHCNAYPPEPTATPAAAETPPPSPTPAAPEPVAPTPVAEASPAAAESVSGSTATVLVVPPEPEAPQAKAPEAPAPEEITPQTPEPAPDETAHEPEPPVGVPEPAAAAEPVVVPPSREMQALATQKPAAVRVKLFALKKAELVDLCTVYHLDSSGPKDQLQDRLLSHLHDLESGPSEGKAPAPEELPPAEPKAAPIETPAPAPSEPAPSPVAAAIPVVLREPEPAPAAPQPEPVAVTPAPVAPETPRLAPRAEHPCPTCGRELTYISQYNRYYCYSCQRYAPAGARAKNACPTCGSTMRWIEQHRRWWCDSCQRYASVDLPAPGAAAVAAATATAPTVKAVIVHRHGSPAGGAGLVGFGLALYIVYAFFGFLGDMLGFVRPAAITIQALDALQFFAFLLVALGAIVGLYGLRDRQ